MTTVTIRRTTLSDGSPVYAVGINDVKIDAVTREAAVHMANKIHEAISDHGLEHLPAIVMVDDPAL